MTLLEIFENLMLPLKGYINDEKWAFLMSRGEKFIEQIKSNKSPLSSVSGPIEREGWEQRIKELEKENAALKERCFTDDQITEIRKTAYAQGMANCDCGW